MCLILLYGSMDGSKDGLGAFGAGVGAQVLRG